MKIKVILWFLIPLCGFSCKPLYLRINGIREPKLETIASVRKKLTSYSRTYVDYLCIPKDSMAFIQLIELTRNIPSTAFFLPNGYKIITQDSGYCPGVTMNFAKALRSDSSLRVDTAVRFPQLAKNLEPVGQKVILDTKSYQYTVIFVWANFMGVVNQHNFIIRKELEKEFPGRINYLYVNMDVQESWHMVQNPYDGLLEQAMK